MDTSTWTVSNVFLHVLCYRFSVPSSIVFIRSAIFRLSNHPHQFTRIEELIFHENNRKTIIPMVLNEENDEFQANLSFLIRRWLQFRTKKNDYFTVQMECPNCFNSSLSDSRSRRSSIQSPSLIIRGRHIKTNQCMGEATCCLHQFYMNFTQIGWDNWIIAPRGYMAGYCTGYCSNVASSSSSSDTLHARLLGDSTPPFICAPTSFDTLNIVYAVAERQLHSKRLFALKPVACGCVS